MPKSNLTKDINGHVQLKGENPIRLQPYSKNYKQDSKNES